MASELKCIVETNVITVNKSCVTVILLKEKFKMVINNISNKIEHFIYNGNGGIMVV